MRLLCLQTVQACAHAVAWHAAEVDADTILLYKVYHSRANVFVSLENATVAAATEWHCAALRCARWYWCRRP